MRGQILHYDEAQGFGFIDGADGNRYTVAREDLRRGVEVARGTSVEFEVRGDRAANVFAVRARPHDQAPTVPQSAPAAPQRFGREATYVPPAPAGTGMWGYFRRALTVNYANFRDRARRKEFWSFALLWLLTLFAVTTGGLLIDFAAGNMETGNEAPILGVISVAGWTLSAAVPAISVTARRFHDIGMSGWLILLIFIPYVGWLIVLALALLPSRSQENKMGAGAGRRYLAGLRLTAL